MDLSKKYVLIQILTICLSIHIYSQNQINLANPSFEKYGVNTNQKLEGWNTCLYGENAAPDVHTQGEFRWSNITPAFSGSSYLSLVVRPDSTGENISQRLMNPLIKNKYYSFQIQLAKPERYLNKVQMLGQDATSDELSEASLSFANAVKLQVWGFNNTCDPGELLFETEPIDHVDWRAYQINFLASNDFQHLAFIPVFAKDRAYAGCVFLDDCSPIFETDETYSYTYKKPNTDSLFLFFETNYDDSKDEIETVGSFVKYFPSGNRKNYWIYDFSNQNFYSKSHHENTSYRPRVTEYRYSFDNVLTDKVVFYEYIHHTAYYGDGTKVASIKRYQNGNLDGKQKLFWPSGNVMMEYEMSMEKKYQKRDLDNSLIFDFTQRVKHIYMAPRDGLKLEKFKIPKDSELGDLAITQQKELIMYNSSGGLMGKLLLDDSSFNTNKLLSILRR